MGMAENPNCIPTKIGPKMGSAPKTPKWRGSGSKKVPTWRLGWSKSLNPVNPSSQPHPYKE